MGKNSKATTSTYFGNTTTSNPYAYAKTDRNGNVSGFQNETALNSVYNFVNNSIDSLLNQYLNPNLNSTTNQAKLRSFSKTLNQQTANNLENLVSALSNRNMIRSSQATDLYKNLSNKNTDSIADFANSLLASSQDNTAKILTNLLGYYMQGANYLSNIQNQSIQTSRGNSTSVSKNSDVSSMAQELLPMVLSKILEQF